MTVTMTSETEPASASSNIATARRFVEQVLGAGDMAAFDEIVDDDIVVETGLKPTGPIRGKAEYKRVLGETVGAVFSDGDMTVDDIVATTDGRVVVRFTASATHTGALWGIEATGRRITMKEVHIMRFHEGRLAKNIVGGLNPLEFEMIFAPAISRMLFDQG